MVNQSAAAMVSLGRLYEEVMSDLDAAGGGIRWMHGQLDWQRRSQPAQSKRDQPRHPTRQSLPPDLPATPGPSASRCSRPHPRVTLFAAP